MNIKKKLLDYELPIRTQQDFPIKGVEFIDITPFITDYKIYNDIINNFVSHLEDMKIDYIVSPEARGFLFGCSVANKLNCGFIPSRKINKFPSDFIEKSFSYIKEYGEDSMCLPKLYEQSYKGKNFYIIDDVYATGNTAKAIEETIIELGGNFIGTGVLLNIASLNDSKDLFSVIDVD